MPATLLFSDTFLAALGAWQRGWREIQADRMVLGKALLESSRSLPAEFRTVGQACFRKRFVHKGEFIDLLLRDKKDEGVASWTTDLAFAERLKGLTRPDAVSAAIFCHTPTHDEVVVNIAALWKSADFQARVIDYRDKAGANSDAIWNFKDGQSEVVLTAPLRGTEVIALTGASSPFDELCDRAGIAEPERDRLFRKLLDSGVYVGEPRYINADQSQAAIARSIQILYEKILKARIAN